MCVFLWGSQVRTLARTDEARGLLWLMEEEAVQPGGSEDTLLERLFSYYGPDQGDNKGHALLLKSDKPHHFLLGHSHGTAWVEYDAQGWLSHAKQNPASQNAATLLQDSQKYTFNSLIVLHSSTLQRKYTYLFVSVSRSFSVCLSLSLTGRTLAVCSLVVVEGPQCCLVLSQGWRGDLSWPSAEPLA